AVIATTSVGANPAKNEWSTTKLPWDCGSLHSSKASPPGDCSSHVKSVEFASGVQCTVRSDAIDWVNTGDPVGSAGMSPVTGPGATIDPLNPARLAPAALTLNVSPGAQRMELFRIDSASG